MAFRKGNQLWKLADKQGRKNTFGNPDDMWDAACAYFLWCDKNPLFENKVFSHKDQGLVHKSLPRMRAYTEKGLCVFLGVASSYFRNFEKNNKASGALIEFMSVITRIRDVIATQKFEGAAAGLLQHNIIAYDLGIANKKHDDEEHEAKKIEITVIKKK